ncbi:short-chain dehydrogenase/reductase [Rhizodiscina lignyota]|uniref:Short-chain dehydrogenase/reductase n=1 Tax=Rhizodiscina lignyota TaxID=1504668 RepID=A0A9P4M2Q4_9PEZI|nr:short-chain dehydrogenase/reductase [Rhizodiscina lignyota]
MPTKTVLVTGCSAGGIGDALVREFHSRGLNVFAAARNVSKMAELKEIGINILEMDVTSSASIEAAVEIIKQQTDNGLDLLINNAGVNHVLPFSDCSIDDFRRVIDTNVIGLLAVTHAFLPLLIKAKGTVASIGSVNEVFNPPYQVAYNASKAAVSTIGDTLRVELAPLGVKVVTIMTGAVKSQLFENQDAKNKLPEGSLYALLKERIEKRDFLDHSDWTPAADYAKDVANDLLVEKPKPVLWRGVHSSVAWWISLLGWTGMMDEPMLKRTGLKGLKAPS